MTAEAALRPTTLKHRRSRVGQARKLRCRKKERLFFTHRDYGDQWLSAGTLLLLFVRHVFLSNEDSVSCDSECVRRDCAAQPRTAGAQVITRLLLIVSCKERLCCSSSHGCRRLALHTPQCGKSLHIMGPPTLLLNCSTT